MSQKVDYLIRNYQEGDDQKVVDLLDHVFNGWPDKNLPCSNVDHWRWKYLDAPIKKRLMGIVDSNSRVVGTNLGFYLNVKVDDEIKLCAQETDGSLHEDFRGKGIYYELANFKDKLLEDNGACFSYWVTTNPDLIKRVETLDNRELFPKKIVELVKIKDINLHLQMTGSEDEWLKKLGFIAMNAYSSLQVYKSTKYDKKYMVSEIDHFSTDILVFWEKIEKHFKFIVEKSASYLNWRYCDPRGGKYVIQKATLNNSIIGFVVLRINSYRKYKTGYIVELLIDPEHYDAAYSLLESAIDYFEKNDVNVIRTWVIEKHPLRSFIEKFGFINSRSPPPTIILKPVFPDGNYDIFKKASDHEIHFCIGDTEWI